MDVTGKNNGFPILEIFGYLKNIHKNPKFGRVRQVPIWELGWDSLIGICLTLPNLEFLWVFFKYPKISKIGNPLSFPVCVILLTLNKKPTRKKQSKTSSRKFLILTFFTEFDKRNLSFNYLPLHYIFSH